MMHRILFSAMTQLQPNHDHQMHQREVRLAGEVGGSNDKDDGEGAGRIDKDADW